jgi:signal transduction histidine kinase
VLGLLWNVGALITYGIGNLSFSNQYPTLVAAAFTCLGFLPAVVVHSVLRSRQPLGEYKSALWIVITTYSLSTGAAGLHFYEALVFGIAPSPRALYILTIASVILMAPMYLITRRQQASPHASWVIGLLVFAVSALHLSDHSASNYSWSIELIGHHASLPLAFAILYQDYRFAFADIFLKRALTLVVLVALAFSTYVALVLPYLSASDGHVGSDPRAVGALLAIWIATALLYPSLRKGVAWIVDKVVLRRADFVRLRAEVARVAASHEDEGTIVAKTAELLSSALTAREVQWFRTDWHFTQANSGSAQSEGAWDAVSPVQCGPRGLNATVAIPTAETPRYVITIGELAAGRRLLSDDIAMLDTVAFTLARRIDALRISHERCEQSLREQQISKLATEAELRALRAQINPHFLFNALTTLGHLIQTAPDRALDTLMRLTGLLRGVLRSAGELTTLDEELCIVQSYLEIERARFEERLNVVIDVPSHLRSIQLPPLVIQPLVENAIKHGIAPLRSGGKVTVSARTEADPGIDSEAALLCITVEDTGAGVSEIELAHRRKRGLGLNNVEQRLRCYYGEASSLTVHSAPGVGTIVEARLPIVLEEKPFDDASSVLAERRPA